MGENADSERILRVPKWLMGILFPRKGAQGFSFSRQSTRLFGLVLVMVEICEAALYIISLQITMLLIIGASSALFGGLLVTLFFFPIWIRKDCFGCELGFHVIAHEHTHLRLNSRDEERVEIETLRETRNRLIPLLLSNQSICKGCRFRWYKMLSQSTSEYLREEAQG